MVDGWEQQDEEYLLINRILRGDRMRRRRGRRIDRMRMRGRRKEEERWEQEEEEA